MTRLIDADRFIKDIYDYGEDSIDIISLTNLIDIAPTIEPVKGKWEDIPQYGTMRCSECRTVWKQCGVFSYCPNCGAKMED